MGHSGTVQYSVEDCQVLELIRSAVNPEPILYHVWHFHQPRAVPKMSESTDLTGHGSPGTVQSCTT